MKLALVLTSFLFASHSIAAPAVGDLVRYKLTTTAGTTSQVMEQRIEVTAVNASAGTYVSTISVFFNGAQISKTNETGDLAEATDAESTIDHCSEIPSDIASLETITVLAGTFKVCHIKSSQGTLMVDQYMGNVLFGLVKSTSVDSVNKTSSTFELIEVKKH